MGYGVQIKNKRWCALLWFTTRVVHEASCPRRSREENDNETPMRNFYSQDGEAEILRPAMTDDTIIKEFINYKKSFKIWK